MTKRHPGGPAMRESRQLGRRYLSLLSFMCAVLAAGAQNVVAGPNQAPVATLTLPANGAAYIAPATIPLAATASDSDGTVVRVDFFAGAILIGTATTAPYQAT